MVRSRLLALVTVAVVLVMSGCGTSATTPSAAPTPNASTTASSDEATKLMRASLELFSGGGQGSEDLPRKMGESGDRSLVPVLVELLRFQGAIRSQVLDEVRRVLTELTGEDYGEFGWPQWVEWVGKHPEVQPPPGFAAWKGQLFGLIDPAMGRFLYDGVKARIRVEEIVWGGVRKDGIPDLRDPPVIPPAKATYLNPDDRVFGLSINGQNRAYPLRILNAHEMANDVVGGEPIALAY